MFGATVLLFFLMGRPLRRAPHARALLPMDHRLLAVPSAGGLRQSRAPVGDTIAASVVGHVDGSGFARRTHADAVLCPFLAAAYANGDLAVSSRTPAGALSSGPLSGGGVAPRAGLADLAAHAALATGVTEADGGGTARRVPRGFVTPDAVRNALLAVGVRSKAIIATLGALPPAMNLFALASDHALDHRISAEIRSPLSIEPAREQKPLQDLLKFAQARRLYAAELGQAVAHFAEVPSVTGGARKHGVRSMAAILALTLEVFGQIDPSRGGERFLTTTDLRGFYLSGRYPTTFAHTHHHVDLAAFTATLDTIARSAEAISPIAADEARRAAHGAMLAAMERKQALAAEARARADESRAGWNLSE